jgi:hypothetical protein
VDSPRLMPGRNFESAPFARCRHKLYTEDMRRIVFGCLAVGVLVGCQSPAPSIERARSSPLALQGQQATCRLDPTPYLAVGDTFLRAAPNPDVLPVCRSVAETLARHAFGAPDAAVTFSALMTRAAAEPIIGITSWNRHRLLWIVTVQWHAWTDGSPGTAPRLASPITMDVDAETGLPAGDSCLGCAGLSGSR